MNIFLKLRYFLFRTIFRRTFRNSFLQVYKKAACFPVNDRNFLKGLIDMNTCLEDGLEEISMDCVHPLYTRLTIGMARKQSDDDGENPSRYYYTGAVHSSFAYRAGRSDIVMSGTLAKGAVAVVGLCTKDSIWGMIELSQKDLGYKGDLILVSIIRAADKAVYKINNLTVCDHDISDPNPSEKLHIFVAIAVRNAKGGVDDFRSSSIEVFRYGFTEFVNSHKSYNLRLRNLLSF